MNHLLLAVSGIAKLDEVFVTILEILQGIAYAVIVLKCIMDVIKLAGSGDKKSMLNVVMVNVMLFATCYIVPWIFDLIKEVFSK